jgi:hypothetical protein
MMNFEFRISDFGFSPHPPGDALQCNWFRKFEIRNPKSEIGRW